MPPESGIVYCSGMRTLRQLRLNDENYKRLKVLAAYRGTSVCHEIDRLIAAEVQKPLPELPKDQDKLTKHEAIVLEVLPSPLLLGEAIRNEAQLREATGFWPWQLKAALRGLLRRGLVGDLGERISDVEIGGRRARVHEWVKKMPR